MNTHIYPEYVVSFKMLHSEKVASLIGKEHNGVPEAAPLLDHPVKGQLGSFAVEPGKPPSSGSSNARTPKSPYMPFSMLFEAISPKVSPGEMNK
ncbi:hypothetical protein, partial [Salmonella sp. s58953]|uniref:hypothetical protein n=1 Tax=Salmonella sp. s58953 TaxID=3159711 RepID=UPI00397EAD13